MQEFKTYDEQLQKLEQRGLKCNNHKDIIKILSEENYYNIINGYKTIFLDTSFSEEKYIANTSFEEVYALYNFDRELRNIIFKYILQVENILRTQIAYVFSEKHGCDNYLRYNNFETLLGIGYDDKVVTNRGYQIHNLISKLQSDLANSVKHKDYIKHYVINHGYVPMWVLVNAITLGRLSSFYTLMNQPQRVEVSKHWDVLEKDLKQYILILAYFRNLCAHDERIYNSKCRNSIPDTDIHKKLKIVKKSKRYICGKNDLFSLLIALKKLLPENDFNTLYNKIHGRLISLSNKITAIDETVILESMGFPINWTELKRPKPTRVLRIII